jgi:methyl-accepting chemotaxis protein
MTGSKVLQENMMNVNRQLLTISGVGITILYGLSFILWDQGYLDLPIADLVWAAASSYLLYACTCLLYLVPRLRRWFHYIFPLEMYFTVVIGIYFYHAPLSAYPVWLLPVIYAGMYAHRGAMLVTSFLVLVTAPVEAFLANPDQWNSLVTDVAIASVSMLIVALRMVSLVNRSRAIIAKTEQEVEKNQLLQRENEHLMEEVAATAEEIGQVVQQLTEMAQGMRDALGQIAQGGDEIIASSHDSKQVLLTNQKVVEEQVERSAQIGEATRQAADYAEQVGAQASAGEAVVARIADVMQMIHEQSRDTGGKVEKLTERAGEIRAINDKIADIAKNVTVVAINASIEAARAGVAGRTFQIVAAQVQGLAKQTSEAVEAIGELAVRIQQDLAHINENMAHNTAVVQNGVEVSGEAREKLQEINRAVQHIHDLLRRIATDAGEQRTEAGKIAEGIGLLREKTEQNVQHIEAAAASTEETAAIMDEYLQSAERLRERAQTLQKLIARYGSTEK